MPPFLEELDLRKLINVALIFFFLVLPIARTILEAVKKSRAERARGRPQAPQADDVREGRRRFEELLRGEVHEAAPAAPPPAPPPIVIAEAVPAPASTPFEPTEELREAGGAFDEEALAEAELLRRQREWERIERDRPARDREAASARASVTSTGVTTLPVTAPAIADPTTTTRPSRARRLFPGSTGRVTRDDLRRALMAAEVLGVPVALRHPQSSNAPRAWSA